MSLTLADQYYLKAAGDYPWGLQEVVENLGYALSYDPEHVGANYLMGRLYMEQFQNYEKAEAYFVAAISVYPDHFKACEYYIKLLIRLRRFAEAKRLAAFILSRKGVGRASILRLQALIYEHQMDYHHALECLKKAVLEAFNQQHIYFLKEEMKRIEDKQAMIHSWNYNVVTGE